MLKKTWFITCLFMAGFCEAGDTTKLLNHEVGFNAVALLQQLRIFTVTPGQQPYDLFYNLYYKDKVGLRLGAGIMARRPKEASPYKQELFQRIIPPSSCSICRRRSPRHPG